MTELWGVTCHMQSYNVIATRRHSALTYATSKAGTRFTTEGWEAELT